MRIIKEANSKISLLWGAGKVQQSNYRLLAYAIQTEVENGVLLLNAVTGELIFLDTLEASRLSGLPCVYAPWMDELIKKHFLVRSESDDKKTVDSLRLALKVSDSSKNITNYTILPTTNCNARCFYCYEAGCKHENMSDETANKLVSFMESNSSGKTLNIQWFGGEPLLGMHQIDRICRSLNDKNICFSSTMYSNGYFFDEQSVKRAKEIWKLYKITITLDGTEKIYNETKAYVNPCENPYQHVINNIQLLLSQGVQVEIRFNIGLHNADDLFALVNDLDKQFVDKGNIWVYALPVHYDCGYNRMNLSQEQSDLIMVKFKELYKKIIKVFPNVYENELPLLKHNCCMMDHDSAVLVLPSGVLGKCPDHIDKYFVGSIDEGIADKDAIKSLKERVDFPECALCPLYPGCIKLKNCKSGLICSENDVKLRIEYAKHVMMRLYDDFLIRNQGEKL